VHARNCTRNCLTRNCWTRNCWTRNCWTRKWTRNCWTRNCWTRNCWTRKCWTGNCWTRNCWTRNCWTRNWCSRIWYMLGSGAAENTHTHSHSHTHTLPQIPTCSRGGRFLMNWRGSKSINSSSSTSLLSAVACTHVVALGRCSICTCTQDSHYIHIPIAAFCVGLHARGRT